MLAALLVACSSGKVDLDDTGGAVVSSVTVVVGELGVAVDAAPSPDASTVYYLANNGGDWAAYAAPFDGTGASTALAALTAPRSIVPDLEGTTLYIADSNALYTMSSSGGDLAVLEETRGMHPEGLDYVDLGGAEWLYLTGLSPSGDGSTGLYRLAPLTGTVATVAEGEPFYSPEGVAVASDGSAWVCDSRAGADGGGALIRVADGEARVVVSGFEAGNPCGAALTADERAVLVSGIDEDGRSELRLVYTAERTTSTYSEGIGENVGSGGLHRAKGAGSSGADVFAWAGVNASAEGVVHRVEVE